MAESAQRLLISLRGNCTQRLEEHTLGLEVHFPALKKLEILLLEAFSEQFKFQINTDKQKADKIPSSL